MGVDRAGQFLRRAFQLKRQRGLAEQYAGVRPAHVDAQQFPRLPVRYHLHESVGLADDLRLAERAEGELLDRHLLHLLRRLLLRHPHSGDLGEREHAGRHDAVIHGCRDAARRVRSGHDRLLAGHVRQQGIAYHVARRVDVRLGRLHVLVDLELPPEPGRQARLLHVQPRAVRTAPHADEHLPGQDFFAV